MNGHEQEKFMSTLSAYILYKLFHVTKKAFYVFIMQGAAQKQNALRTILLLFGDVVAAALRTNFFICLFLFIYFFFSVQISRLLEYGNPTSLR